MHLPGWETPQLAVPGGGSGLGSSGGSHCSGWEWGKGDAMALPRDLWRGFPKELPKRLLGLARGKEVSWAGSFRGLRPVPLMALTQSGPTCACA